MHGFPGCMGSTEGTYTCHFVCHTSWKEVLEMAEWLRSFVLPEDSSSVANTHIRWLTTMCNSITHSWPPQTTGMHVGCVYTFRQIIIHRNQWKEGIGFQKTNSKWSLLTFTNVHSHTSHTHIIHNNAKKKIKLRHKAGSKQPQTMLR